MAVTQISARGHFVELSDFSHSTVTSVNDNLAEFADQDAKPRPMAAFIMEHVTNGTKKKSS